MARRLKKAAFPSGLYVKCAFERVFFSFRLQSFSRRSDTFGETGSGQTEGHIVDTKCVVCTGGTIHGGGRYWWCVRSMWGNGEHNPRALQPALAQHGCATTRAMPNVTRDGQNFTTCPPRMLHIVESKQKNALLFPSFPKYGHF